MTTDPALLKRITVRPDVFGGKPIIRDMRIAVEHVLGMLAAGDTAETIPRIPDSGAGRHSRLYCLRARSYRQRFTSRRVDTAPPRPIA